MLHSTTTPSAFSKQGTQLSPVMTTQEYRASYSSPLTEVGERLTQMQNEVLAEKQSVAALTEAVLRNIPKLTLTMERERQDSERLERGLRDIIASEGQTASSQNQVFSPEQVSSDKKAIITTTKNILTCLQKLGPEMNNERKALEEELLRIVSTIQKAPCCNLKGVFKREILPPLEELFNPDIILTQDEALSATTLQYLQSQEKLDDIENQLLMHEETLINSKKAIIAASQRLITLMAAKRTTSQEIEQQLKEITASERATNTVDDSLTQNEPLLLGRRRSIRPSDLNVHTNRKKIQGNRFSP